jgi:hypothetical protein
MGNLFQQIKDSVKGQKSDFCSRATSVTLLESGNKEIPFNLVVNYTDCDKKPKTVNYQEVVMNGNYIPDCVQGGSPISITDGGGIEIPKQPMDSQQTSYKSFVQYGTTNCETPPPSGENKILFPCQGSGEVVVVDTTGYNLTQGSIYEMTLNPLNPGPIPRLQCFTVGEQTNQQAEYNIMGIKGTVEDCNVCGGPPPFFSYIVGDTSYNNQIDACTSGEKKITVYSSTNEPIVNSTFLYINPQLTIPYDSKGFVYYSGREVYAISTGSDGKLTSLTPCAA